MGKFKLVIKDVVSGEVVKEVEIDESIEQYAKDKAYDVLLAETNDLPDGEYTGELYRWMPNIEQWVEVGAPVIACEVKDGEPTLTVDRIDYLN